MTIREQIKEDTEEAIFKVYGQKVDIEIQLPTNSSNGDFATPAALLISKKIGKAPMDVANEIASELRKEKKEYLDRIEVAKPGFLNIWLSEKYLISQAQSLLSGNEKIDLATKSQKVMVEFGDPNPFKEIHIGHLRNFTISESYARLLEWEGYRVARANYQGDVGMHVAKAIWGMIKDGDKLTSLKTLPEKVRFLATSYTKGAKAFEEDDKAKAEIQEINKKVYRKDANINKYWEMGRKWSLDSFEEIYKLFGVSYDYYYFESQTAPEGKKLVEKFEKKGIFEKDDGAVILRGEKTGLHTRVFITKEGNPTYEAKDLALAIMKYKDFSFDKSYVITANEQVDYFKVILKALSLIDPEVAEKSFHDSFGFVNLKEGKMSSRSGNVVPARWLIEEVKKSLVASFKEISDETLEKVAIGAIKYSMLRFARESDIKFSFEESVNLTGNSGPYIQYAFARIQSILKKSTKEGSEKFSQSKLASEELAVLRQVCYFHDAIFYSAENFAPNILCNYLYEISTKFNLFYEKHKVIGGENEELRVLICSATGEILKKGLYLLGIDAPDKL